MYVTVASNNQTSGYEVAIHHCLPNTYSGAENF